MTENEGKSPKIIVDDDWKSQVAAEKERLKKQETQGGPAEPAGPAAGEEQMELPPASFSVLLTTLATQAVVAMGQVQLEGEEPPPPDMPAARHFIDMLGVLDEKTKGNLTAEEEQMLSGLLGDLRMMYVSAAGMGKR